MKRFLSLLLITAVLLLPATLGCQRSSSSEEPIEPSSVQSEAASLPESSEPAPISAPYPVGKMFVTQERLAFNNGDLILRVPRLNLETSVVGEFSPEVREKLVNGTMTKQERADFFGNSGGDLLLKTGVVLLNSSTLPDPFIPNSNVSISGHRDIDGAEFYDIHKMTTGDLVYLTYGGREYVYEWQSTVVHKPDDWTITFCGDESVVSLISCDPIGTSRNRIVATCKLIEYRDLEPEVGSSSSST